METQDLPLSPASTTGWIVTLGESLKLCKSVASLEKKKKKGNNNATGCCEDLERK